MNPATVVAILQMILAAEPAVVQTIHDLLVGTGGQSDQAVLTSDLADWNAIIAKAKEQLAPPPPITQ
jgi:hypothetical protein